jgi:hypothetical protein
MNNGMKIMANCGRNSNKHKNESSAIPKNSESFVWKDTNWRKIELRLNIVQTKIYVAKQDNDVIKVRKLQKLMAGGSLLLKIEKGNTFVSHSIDRSLKAHL